MHVTDTWFSLILLATVDLTDDLEAEKQNLAAELPKLREMLDAAQNEVSKALLPVPATHPADDTWDDQIYFLRALIETGHNEKAVNYELASAQLTRLEASPDPARAVAGYVLDDATAFLKDRGLDTPDARLASQPASLGGLSLAEVVWQARNQKHHQPDTHGYHQPTLDSLRSVVAGNPGMFGRTTPPTSDPDLDALLKERSWAPEFLRLIGWTTPAAVAAGIGSIM